METPTCETCRFWWGGRRGEDGGECRRYPPTFLPIADRMLLSAVDGYHRDDGAKIADIAIEEMRQGIDGFVEWHSPTTSADFWCGEHQPSEGEG